MLAVVDSAAVPPVLLPAIGEEVVNVPPVALVTTTEFPLKLGVLEPQIVNTSPKETCLPM